MKDSYLSCFHEVDLTEEKWFWNHRREVCVAYAIGYSQLVRGMCDIQLDAWKQWFSFILCVLQTSFSTGRTAALSTSRGVQRVRPWSEEGVLVLLYTPPPSSSFPSLLLHGTAAAAALHTEKRAQPERCCFWDSSRPCSMSKMEEREKFRKSIFQPHAASFLQLSLNLCLFYVTFVLAACLI